MLFLLLYIHCIFAADRSTPHYGQWHGQEKQPLMTVIEAMIKEIAERHACIVYIIDSHYNKILDATLIEKTELMTIYLISLQDDENFLSPWNHTRTSLAASKMMGCDAYVILNKNGSQVSQLLQYGEQNRLINTRGDFLLLYDHVLFKPEMKSVWNRIINVIFIRRYGASKYLSGKQVPSEWFDLDTVHFPIQGESGVVSRQVDTWHHGKFRYGNDHFLDKITNLRKKSLRVAIFKHIPAVTKSASIHAEGLTYEGKTEALGVEYELMRILAEAMNFKASVYSPPDSSTERWGRRGENGSYSGLLGEAIAGKAAFFLGDLYYTSSHLKLLDLSTPYNTECLTFLTPESLTDNSWKLLVMPFKVGMWVTVLSTLFMGGFIFYIFSRFYKSTISLYKKKPRCPMDMAKVVPGKGKTQQLEEPDHDLRGLYIFTERQNSILYTYGMLLVISLPRLPSAWALRVFIGWWWLFSILVAVTYRASMTAILANPTDRVTIDTLAELAKSSIAAGSWGEDKRDFFLSSLDMDSRKIGRKFELIDDEENAIARVAAGSFAYYENEFSLRHARAIRQNLKVTPNKNATQYREILTADRNLHIMRECAIIMPISIGLDKNSPLKPRVDDLVRRVAEAGLVQKWLSDVMQSTVNAETPDDSSSQKALIDLHKLYGALVALGIGYFLGFIALFGEIIHWKYIVQKDPTYDKYYLDVYYKNARKLKA